MKRRRVSFSGEIARALSKQKRLPYIAAVFVTTLKN
jgi:hypothetical protein